MSASIYSSIHTPGVFHQFPPPAPAQHTLSDTMSGSFSYVLIPADPSLPIEQRTASKSGGLSDDALQKEAKRYFYDRSDKKAMQGKFLCTATVTSITWSSKLRPDFDLLTYYPPIIKSRGDRDGHTRTAQATRRQNAPGSSTCCCWTECCRN